MRRGEHDQVCLRETWRGSGRRCVKAALTTSAPEHRGLRAAGAGTGAGAGVIVSAGWRDERWWETRAQRTRKWLPRRHQRLASEVKRVARRVAHCVCARIHRQPLVHVCTPQCAHARTWRRRQDVAAEVMSGRSREAAGAPARGAVAVVTATLTAVTGCGACSRAAVHGCARTLRPLPRARGRRCCSTMLERRRRRSQ